MPRRTALWLIVFGLGCAFIGAVIQQQWGIPSAYAAKEPVEVKLVLCDDVINYWSKRFAYCQSKDQIDCMDMAMSHMASIFSGCK